MITLVVLGVLAALAAPSFSNLINSNRLAAAANEVVAALQVARMEAIRRGGRIVLCPSTDGASCSGTEWRRLIVFADSDGNNAVNGEEPVIRDVSVATGNVQVKASGNVTANDRIRFSGEGLVWVGGGSDREGAISVCSPQLPVASNTRDVEVKVSRISVVTRNGTSACTALAN